MTARNHWHLGHARLVEYEAGFALEDLGTPQGTHVNGIRLTPGKPIWVKPTDAFLPPFPWPAPHSATVPQPVAWSRQITIGSAPDADIVLQGPGVTPAPCIWSISVPPNPSPSTPSAPSSRPNNPSPSAPPTTSISAL